MKILFVAESFPTTINADVTGGVEMRDFFVALGLSHKHTVTVLTAARLGADQKQLMDQLRILRVGRKVPANERESLSNRLYFAFKALMTARHLDFDVVMGSNVFTNPLAYLIGQRHDKPAIAFVADVYLGRWRKLTGNFTGMAGEVLERIHLHLNWQAIISCSQVTAQKLVHQGIPKSLIKVIYSGVDTQSCRLIEVAKAKHPTIVYAGRLVSYKRLQDLIHALPQIRKFVPQTRLVIVGDGPYRPQLEALTKNLGLSKVVSFTGFLATHEEVLRTIKSSHLFCLPSVVEGFGHVTVEAMACGVPFVHADIETNQEITDHGQGGLLFAPQNPDDLATKAIELLTNDQLYKQKVSQGLATSAQYDWNNIITQTEKYIKKVISSYARKTTS